MFCMTLFFCMQHYRAIIARQNWFITDCLSDEVQTCTVKQSRKSFPSLHLLWGSHLFHIFCFFLFGLSKSLFCGKWSTEVRRGILQIRSDYSEILITSIHNFYRGKGIYLCNDIWRCIVRKCRRRIRCIRHGRSHVFKDGGAHVTAAGYDQLLFLLKQRKGD
jgi:hypothetical protein